MTPEQFREQVHGIIPDSWLGITGPLTDEQEKDLAIYYRHMRHTVDIDRRPMRFEDAGSDHVWARRSLWMAVGVVVYYAGRLAWTYFGGSAP